MNLREQAISGILWSFCQQFGAKIVSLLISIILARILNPAEFGLLAMINVLIAMGSSLMDSGLTSSLIRTNDATQKDYSTIFYFNMVGGIVAYIIVFLVAPMLARFYDQEILTEIIRIMGITFIINSFFAVQNAKFIKQMNFKIQTMIQIPSVIGGGIVGIVMANSGFGVWSLVWMSLCNSFLLALMHWMFSDWRPRLIFDFACFKKHFGFGYKMTLSGLLETLFQNIYVIIIGKYHVASQLGFYSRAESMSQFPVSNISAAVNKATYPMFAAISDDNVRLKLVYKRLLKQVIFWNAPVLVFLVVIAEPLFRILLTEKWLPAVPYFQLLCISGIMYPLQSYNLNILKVKGRSDLLLKLELIKKVTCIIGIICVIPFGIYGLLYFRVGYSFVGYYINSLYSGRFIDYSIIEQIQDLWPSIFLSCSIGALMYSLDHLLAVAHYLPDIQSVILNGLLFSIIYLISSSMLKLTAITDFKQLILKR